MAILFDFKTKTVIKIFKKKKEVGRGVIHTLL
jgi:hypothetical protein